MKLLFTFFALFAACLGQTTTSSPLLENIIISPISIRRDIPVVFFGGNSNNNNALFGPKTLISSGIVDVNAGTITLPLHSAKIGGGSTNSSGSTSATEWFILTDVSDTGAANSFGLNFAPKLSLLKDQNLVRTFTIGSDGVWTFQSGTVTFGQAKSLPVINANTQTITFPLSGVSAAQTGDSAYFPFASLQNSNVVYNAPVVASGLTATQLNQFCNGVTGTTKQFHERVVSICPQNNTVVLKLSTAFADGVPIWYLAMDASDASVAAIENATFVPSLKFQSTSSGSTSNTTSNGLQCVGFNAFCPVNNGYFVINGPTNALLNSGTNTTSTSSINPFRQGLISSLAGEGEALPVFPAIPERNLGYTPLLDMLLVEWTQQSITSNLRTRLTSQFDILGLLLQGWLTGINGEAVASEGFLLNAPVAYKFF